MKTQRAETKMSALRAELEAEFPKPISVRVTGRQLDDLNKLRATGYFGATVGDVFEGLLREALRRACLDGWLPMPKPPKRSKVSQ